MATQQALSTIHYHVSFPNANAHYVQITMYRKAKKAEDVIVKMPVWTPGSYKVREFSQHVDQTKFESNGKVIEGVRQNKNTWSCVAPSSDQVSFTYNLYAFELGVRTSYVDQFMAFLHGPSAFMYFDNYTEEDIEITFDLPSDWKNIEVSLPKVKGKVSAFSCDNYDLLADSPFALGNFDIAEYSSGGTPHRIVMIGEGNYDLNRIQEDFKRITDEEVNMFEGKHPSKLYTHFIQNVTNGGGGLEHLNCQTSQMNRWDYADEEKYRKFLGLISHEYFHLWNVKRIRPIELGPFNYDQENYTEQLWVAEGITSYFDDLFLKRTNIHTSETYLAEVAYNINRLENQPGKDVMNLAESSKLAWVKAYLTNENSNNVTISYYNKGMLVAWALDLKIMELTNGEKRLDQVMRALYQNYHVAQKRGFTHVEFVETCNSIAGSELTPFFNKYVFTTEPIDYKEILSTVGMKLENVAKSDASLGFKSKTTNGTTEVTYIKPFGAAQKAGLSVNDEVISINGWRVTGDINLKASEIQAGDKVEMLIARDGKILQLVLKAMPSTTVNYKIVSQEDATDEQLRLRKIWLGE